MSPVWTAIEDQELKRRHAAGESLGAIAEAMQRSKSTVGRKSKLLGLKWDRSRVNAAIAAHQSDARARRAALQLALLGDAERLREQLWRPATYIDHGGRDYVRVRWQTPTPIYADQLRIMQAVAVAVDRAIKLADHDSSHAEAGRSLLGALAEAIGLPDALAAAAS